MLIGSSLDLKKEIASKKQYQPSGDIARYIDAQFAEFSIDQQQFLKQWPQLNDRSLMDYMTLAEEDLYKFVPAPQDPNDWRNFIRSGGERAGLDTLLSFLLDLNFQCEPESRDWMGVINEAMGEVGGAFIKFIDILDQAEVKSPQKDLAMFTHGTLIAQIKFNTIKGIGKIASDWNPKKFDGYSYKTRLIDRFEGIESTIWKPNRFYFSDVSQPDINKQEHIWYEAVIPYANAYQIFGEWEMWKYVLPYSPQYDQWTDTDIDVTMEDKQINDKVRIRVRESVLSNEQSIYCNKVLMTPPGLKMEEEEYSFIVQQASSLYPTGFVYGRSYMDNLRPFFSGKDVLSSVLVDKARQSLEPPMKSRFRVMLNKYMFRPSAVTPIQGEGDLTPLLPTTAVDSFVFEALKLYDQMAKDASPSPILQVQQGGADKTRRQIELEMQGAIRAAANNVAASCGWRRQEARKKLNLGLNHFAKVAGFKFNVDSEGGAESKLIELGKVPSKQRAFLNAVKKMSEAENLAKAKGKRVKKYLVDPEKMKEYSFVINFRVNPSARDSKSSDLEDAEKKIGIYRQDQNLDQKEVSRMMIKAFGDDEDTLMPQKQPGEVSQQQMGMEQAQGQEQHPEPQIQPQQTEPQTNPQPQPMM